MKITIITAVSLILAGGLGDALQAQIIKPSAEPAEYPPASFNERQYVDSKGCVFIRAGIDGNVTWVPRVNRSRQQLCGATPTNIAGATKANPNPIGAEVITLAPEDQVTEQPLTLDAPVASPVRPLPKAVQAASIPAPVKPQRTAESTSTGAVRATLTPARAAATVPQPVRTAVPQIVTSVPATPSVCVGALCGAQGGVLTTLTSNTRILPAHLYQERLQAADLRVPDGYKPAWEDGRLNTRRAEQTIRLTVIDPLPEVPAGYARVNEEADHMNPMRGIGTDAGDAQMAQIWSNSLPRQTLRQPETKEVFKLSEARAQVYGSAQQTGGQVMRLSTRSAPGAELPTAVVASKPRYVRAITLSDPQEAAQAAKALAAATGLDIRLGALTRNGQEFKVVLAGPFTHGAERALERIRAAGYSGARLSK